MSLPFPGRRRAGIPEEAFSQKMHADKVKEWRGSREMALTETEQGAIVIASVPTGTGMDILMGTRCEVWLFPDGTYHAQMYQSWVKPGSAKRGAAVRKHLEDGCRHHPSCFDCPEEDCVLPTNR